MTSHSRSNPSQSDIPEFSWHVGNKGFPFKSASFLYPVQGVWKDHLEPFCISLILGNEKHHTLLCPPAGTGGEMCLVKHTGVGEGGSSPTWRWGPLGSFFLSGPQASLWPEFKSTARTQESYYSALTDRCTVEALFLFMWCQIFRDGSFKNNVHV